MTGLTHFRTQIIVHELNPCQRKFVSIDVYEAIIFCGASTLIKSKPSKQYIIDVFLKPIVEELKDPWSDGSMG